MARLKTPALVLRVTRYRDADLIILLLGRDCGRFSVIARGARKSTRRFGAPLEIGTRLIVEASTRVGRDLHTLVSCGQVAPLRFPREDLDAYHQISYVLEIVRLSSREGASDPMLFDLTLAYVDAIEKARAATPEGLIAWELALLDHLGYRMRFAACVRTGRPPDAISLTHGGAVARNAVTCTDAIGVPTGVIATLDALVRGDRTARIERADAVIVHRALALIWSQITGYVLRTSRYL